MYQHWPIRVRLQVAREVGWLSSTMASNGFRNDWRRLSYRQSVIARPGRRRASNCCSAAAQLRFAQVAGAAAVEQFGFEPTPTSNII